MSNRRAKPIPTTPVARNAAIAKPATNKLPSTTKPPMNPMSSKPTQAVRKLPLPTSPPAGRSSNAALSKPAVPKGPVKAPRPRQPQPQREDNWLNRTVQNSIAGVGVYAGGFINSIGDSVNQIGEGVGNRITNTSRYWGQGVAGYGNNIKDSVGIGGPRVATGGNPLGLAGQGSSYTTQTGTKPAHSLHSKGKGRGANPLGLRE